MKFNSMLRFITVCVLIYTAGALGWMMSNGVLPSEYGTLVHIGCFVVSLSFVMSWVFFVESIDKT